jgi:hypothetical protein
MNENKNSASKFIIGVFIPILLLTALGRILSVIYGNITTDIMYAESFLPDFLYYSRSILAILTRGFGFAVVIFNYMNIGRRAGNTAAALVVAVDFLDSASSFAIDMIQTTIVGQEVTAIINLTLNFLFGVLIIVTIAVMSIRTMKGTYTGKGGDYPVTPISLKNPPIKAILNSSVLILLVGIISEAVYTVQFLIEYNFALYSGEILAIISAYITIILTDGVLTFAVIMVSYALLYLAKSRKNV